MKSKKLDAEYTSGEEMEAMAKEMMSQRPEVVERLRESIGKLVFCSSSGESRKFSQETLITIRHCASTQCIIPLQLEVIMSSSWENVRVDGSKMRTYVSVPEGSSKVPGIVIVQGQTGVDDFLQFTQTWSRAKDSSAAAPDLYHRDPADCKDDAPTRRMRLTDTTVIADVNATVEFLKSHPAVDSARIGIVGFCMGGRAVYLMSALNPDLKAGVMYYGGDPFHAWGDGPSPFERTAQNSLPDHGPLRRRR